MRILPPLPLSEGYVPPSAELNLEEGIIDITHPSDCILMEDSQMMAETLILRCALNPIPLRDTTLKVQLITEGETLGEAHLYQEDSLSFGYEHEVENSHWEGIALDYTGTGKVLYQGKPFDFQGTTGLDFEIETTCPLYVKPFRYASHPHQERVTTFHSGQVLTTPPGIIDSQVLHGYGGYYKEGVPLEDIQQIYYSLTSAHTQTRVRLISSSTLHKQHTPPPRGGKVHGRALIFHPCLSEEEYLSLPGALVAGYARLFVSAENGKVPFSSFHCEPLLGYPKEINLYFRPTLSLKNKS